MRLIPFLIFLGIVWPDISPGQSRRICIVDSRSMQPIPFASIRSLSVNAGTYSNAAGEARFEREFGDSIMISSVGYQSKIVTSADIKNDTIKLVPQPMELPIAVVKPWHKTTVKTLGIVNAKRKWEWTSAGFGEEFAQKIFLPDSAIACQIKSVSIAMERFDETIPTILHIYSVAENGIPGRDILMKQIVLRKSSYQRKKKRLVVDLSGENILISDSACFVGIEWLPVFPRKKGIASSAIIVTDDLQQRLTFIRAGALTPVKWIPEILLPGQQNVSNSVICITVDALQ